MCKLSFHAFLLLFLWLTVPPAFAGTPSAPHLAGATSCVAGTAGVSPVATIAVTLPTSNVDGTPVATPLTINLYQGTASGGETQVKTGLTGSTISVNTGLGDAQTFYWKISVTDANGNTSALSNEGCKSFPAGTPNAATIVVS